MPVTIEGAVEGVVAVARDVTDRKRRERTLERRSRGMDAAPIGITITDPSQEDDPLVYVNERFEEVTG
jgi:PAS domain-containing protein